MPRPESTSSRWFLPSAPFALLAALALACQAAGAAELGAVKARRLLAQYRLEEAETALQPALDDGTATEDELLLAGRIREEMGDGPGARRLFSDAVGKSPSSVEARCYLARALIGLKEYKAAAVQLRAALRSHAHAALPLAIASLYYLQKGNYPLSQKYARRALDADPANKEAALVQADLMFLKRDLEGAKETVTRLLSTHPADPDGLYMMGIVLFNQKDFDGAQRYLERSTGIHRYASNFLKDLAQVYAQNGALDRAIETLERVLELAPGDESATSLRDNLLERRDLLARGVTRRAGPFRFVLPPGLPESTFQTILRVFQDAYRDVSAPLAYRPPEVKVWVFEKTGSLLPAFYSHVSDEIIISRAYFAAFDTPQKTKLGRHLIYHEFSHLVLFQALGRPAFSPLALWLMEGLAEKQAGGYDYTAIDYGRTFEGGLMDFTELGDYLPVSAVGAGEKREKAYIQAHWMVDCLLASPGGLDHLRKMVLAYSSGQTDAEVLAAAGLGTPKEFLERVTEHIRVRRPEAALD